MPLPGLLKTTTRRGATVLAVEADGMIVRGTLFVRQADGAMLPLRCLRSSRADLAGALGEIAEAVHRDGLPQPGAAVLLSSQVHVSVLQIPVDPQRPLPHERMQQMLRWEIEPYMSRVRDRRIGSILRGRGYINADEHQRILGSMNSATHAPAQRPPRFGEVAVAAGLVTREQLEECLALQEESDVFEGPAVCGWMPLEGNQAAGRWRWLVAGVTEPYRRHAREAFAAAGLRLVAIYPLAGCAGAVLNGRGDSACSVLEYQSGLVSCTRLIGGRIQDSRTAFTQEAGNPLQLCCDLLRSGSGRIWLAGRWPDLDRAVREIGVCLERPAEILTVEAAPEGEPAAGLAGVAGAVLHGLEPEHAGRAVAVAAEDPLPPVLTSRLAQAALVGLLFALGLAAVAFGWHERGVLFERRVELQKDVHALRERLRTVQTRQSALRERIDFLETHLPERRRLLAHLLTEVRACCSPQVQIQQMSEEDDGTLRLRGWSLSPQHAEAFRLKLQQRLTVYRPAVSETPVRQEKGWQGLEGYAFEFALLPAAESRP